MSGIKLFIMNALYNFPSTKVLSKEDVDKIIEDSGSDLESTFGKVASTLVSIVNPIALIALIGMIVLKLLGILDMKKFLIIFGGTLVLLILANVVNSVL